MFKFIYKTIKWVIFIFIGFTAIMVAYTSLSTPSLRTVAVVVSQPTVVIQQVDNTAKLLAIAQKKAHDDELIARKRKEAAKSKVIADNQRRVIKNNIIQLPNYVNQLVRCNMYLNAMDFTTRGEQLRHLIITSLRESGVTSNDQRSIQIGLRKITKDYDFVDVMQYYANDCKKLGLMN